jgi:alpha-L-arabinofuranosidase
MHGGVGVGSWETGVEFKDLKVEKDGKTIFAADFSKNMDGLLTSQGEWEARDGVLRQTSDDRGALAYVVHPDWTDYTLNVKARKLDGAEGFLILFHLDDNDTFTAWNIGGWGNTRHQLQRTTDDTAEDFGNGVRGKIENGKWYDIRIELSGDRVKAYLDGKLVHDARYKRP